MGVARRFAVATIVTVADLVLAVLYYQVWKQGFRPRFSSNGPLTDTIMWMDSVVLVVIGGTLLAIWTWFLVGGVQEEKAVGMRRPR